MTWKGRLGSWRTKSGCQGWLLYWRTTKKPTARSSGMRRKWLFSEVAPFFDSETCLRQRRAQSCRCWTQAHFLPPELPTQKQTGATKPLPEPYRRGPRLQMRIDVQLRTCQGLITAIILEHPSLLSSPFTSDWFSIVPHRQCWFEELLLHLQV